MSGPTVPDNPAAPAAAPVDTPAGSEPAPAPAPVPMDVDPRTYLKNPLLEVAAEEPGAGAQPNPEAGEPQPAAEPSGEPKLLAGKFESPEKLEEAYTALEAKLGTQGSEIGQLRRQQQEFDQLREQLLYAANNPQPATNNPQAPAPPQSAEEIIQAEFGSWDEEKQEAFMTDLYTNGPEAMSEAFKPLLNTAIEQMKAEVGQFKTELSSQVGPIIADRQFNEKAQTFAEAGAAFAEQNPDFNELRPQIGAMLDADPELAEMLDAMPPERAIPMAYTLAKGMGTQQLEKAPTVDDLLKDPDAITKFAQSDEVKNLVLQGHATKIKENKPPVVIGSQPGGEPAATAPIEIKSLQDAKRAFLNSLV